MLRMLRREDERTLESRGILRRGTGEGTFDADGNWTPGGSAVATDVPCRIRPSLSSRSTRTVDVGGVQITLSMYDLKVPHDLDAREGDVFEPTVSRDASLIGRHLVVREVVFDEWVVTRVLVCEAS
jgi:hypothetical protein